MEFPHIKQEPDDASMLPILPMPPTASGNKPDTHQPQFSLPFREVKREPNGKTDLMATNPGVKHQPTFTCLSAAQFF